MNSYSFTYTAPDGTKRIYKIEAESLAAALAIYRQRIKENA